MVITRSSSKVRFFIPFEPTRKHTQNTRKSKSTDSALSHKSEYSSDSENLCQDFLAMPNLTLPTAPFSIKDPEGWFRQLEAIFALSKIEDDETKFIHLQARMDPTILYGVSEFFSKIPENGKYDALKKKIIGNHSVSRDAQVLQLLEGLSLGDRQPRELLGEIIRLADNDISKNVTRTMFVKKLPESIGGILISSSEPLDKLGELANKLYAFHKNSQQHHIAGISAPSPVAPSVPMEAELQQIKTMLSSLLDNNIKLTSRVAVLEAGLQFTRPSRSSYRSQMPPLNRRNRSTSRGKMPEDSKFCYYHYTYMGKAKNCKTLADGSACRWNSLNA